MIKMSLISKVRLLIPRLRAALYKSSFKKVGKNFAVGKHCKITGAKNIEIGNNICIKDFCELRGI